MTIAPPTPAETQAADAPTLRLSNQPDWIYLLREYYEMYRNGSAGGSVKIRSHQRVVRERIAKVIDRDAALHFEQPLQKPVCQHLKRALDQGRLACTAPLIRAVESVADQLRWEYGYNKVPKSLAQKYAYCEILGPRGPVVAADLILGLVLFAPKCVYPAHAHDGITESYYCLSGAMSENDDGVFAPGSLIFNPPLRNHRITIGDREPCLLAYAWSGSEQALGGFTMTFSRKTAGA